MLSIPHRFSPNFYKWLAGLTVVALIGGLFLVPRLIAGPGRNAAAGASRESVALLQAQSGGALTVHWDEQTGVPDFLMGPLPYQMSEAERGSPARAAIGVLSRYRDVFGLNDPANELAVVRVEEDRIGQTHVRLRQIHNGVPVWAKSLYVHLEGATVLGINGHYIPDLNPPSEAKLTEAEARQIALDAESGAIPSVDGAIELTIYVADDGTSVLAYQIPIATQKPYSRLAYFIDSQTGAVAHVSPLMDTAKYRLIYDAQLKENLPGKLLAQEGETPRDAAGAAAYKNLGTTYDYYSNTFQRDSFDAHGGQIVGVVHHPGLGNSFWNGELLAFGDEDNYISNKPDALVLDIAAHELTHAVTQYTAGLIYEAQSGALNESFSDVFAVMVDREDWHLFEDNSQSPPIPRPWLRDMQDPSLGGNYDKRDPGAGFGQPTTMADYANLPVSRDADWGGVHINSGIPNHLLYLFATATSREVAEQVFYRTLTNYLTEDSDFALYSLALSQSTKDLYGATGKEFTALQAALKAQGLVTASGTNSGPTAIPPTQGPRATVAPTPTQIVSAGCTQLVQNSGFEAARSDPWVEITQLNAALITGDFPRTGKKSAWLGGTDEEAFQYIYQDIAIPANVKAAVLSYWHYSHEEISGQGNVPDATFQAIVADTQGNVLAVAEEFASSDSDDTWAQSSIDLSSLAGKKIRLAFVANMVAQNTSSFFVDDVAVQACTTGTPVTKPAPSGGGVQVQGTVTDAATGNPIAGAVVYILKPGVTASQAAADGQITASEYLTEGTTDRNGKFVLKDRLPRGQTYSGIAIANGYKPIIADNAFQITNSDTDPYDLSVEMQKSF